MKYISPKEAAEKWGISQRRVHTLCSEGRVEGAVRHSRVWLIPESAEKPADERIKSGRYIKRNPYPSAVVAEADELVHMVQPETEEYTLLRPSPPRAVVFRPRLIEKIAPPGSSLTYIHADAGYGKTTLLMQYTTGRNNVIWLSLDERDSDLMNFLRHLENAFRKKLPRFDFYVTDLLPFAADNTFVSLALTSLLKALGHRKLILILDDVHVISDGAVMDFLTRLAKSCPQNLTLVMAGRHELRSSLFRLKMDGRVAELTKADLRFSREEAEELWGFFDEAVYQATEGWALALQSYRMASEAGKIRLPHNDRNLNHYLMNEIFNQLPEETRHFLLATAWFPELNPNECNRLLGIKNTREILDWLVHRNIFTVQVSTVYRYHTLFASFLRQNDNGLGLEVLRRAMSDCFARGEYERAADYALLIGDGAFIHDCIKAELGRPFGKGHYGNLKGYFDCMEAQRTHLSPEVLLARGLYLSSQGRFYEAEQCLNEALPKLSGDSRVLLQVMAHKARILRNKASYEESNRLIDSMLPLPDDAPPEDWYLLIIEKIHNLTLSTRLCDALELTLSMVKKCAAYGNARVRAWFERYLTVIYFYQGNYKKCLHYYEKSLSLPEEEQDWLARHSVGAYAAKAYQVTGQEEKAVSLMEAELSRLRRLGLHEEMSLNYLMYAEILLAEEMRKSIQGGLVDLSEFNKYLELAEEHVDLKRNSGNYMLFIKILHMDAELLARSEKALYWVKDILELVEHATPYFRALAFGRLANAFHTLEQDMEQSKAFYRKCIETGEAAGTLVAPMIAYGGLAAIYLREKNETKAEECARRCLTMSMEYGHRYYFQIKSVFGEVLKFAQSRGITPEFTREMLAYSGYAAQKVYINTLGTFYIAPAHDRHFRVKIRTQKSRELLAYLLEHREGVSRQRIYADLWGDSEADVTRLFHTRRGEIRRAFESLGAKNPILREKDVYKLNMEEIICDYDNFRQVVEDFRKKPVHENAQRVVDHYTGRYLDDMEALWAESSRLLCENSFLQAAETLLENYRESGEQAKIVELLRRCVSLNHHGHRIDASKEGKRKKNK
ncbi:MAG TPA: AAA family ATPase [Clostridiaceae bacterium]|nr:AAA family ATPase [Clostridiaceae bacterium]